MILALPFMSGAPLAGTDNDKTPGSFWRNWGKNFGNDPSLSSVAEVERRALFRRNYSVKSFAYGSFHPRRRMGRREGDLEDFFLDWHEPRVLYLSLAIVLMCCADALFTLNLMATGAEEINYLMNMLIAENVQKFLALKIGITCLSVVVLGVASRRRFLGLISIFRVLQLFCAGYAALIVWELWLFSVYVRSLSLDWRHWPSPL